MVLSLFATGFAAYAEGIRVSFMQSCLFCVDINGLLGVNSIQTSLDEIYK